MTLTDFEIDLDIDMDAEVSCTFEDSGIYCQNPASWAHNAPCCGELVCLDHHNYYLNMYEEYETVMCDAHYREIYSDDMRYYPI